VCLANTEHEFVNLHIFDGPGRDQLAAKNPAMKVPVLEDKEQLIFDSRVIYRYLAEKYQYAPLSWEQENQLTLIDAINDSFVQLFMLKRSEIEAGDDSLFYRMHFERIEASLAFLERQVEAGEFASWQYPAICLYTLIDWVEFRQLHGFKDQPHLRDFHQQHQSRIEFTATDPRVSE
jgi:glutathione S-transferase